MVNTLQNITTIFLVIFLSTACFSSKKEFTEGPPIKDGLSDKYAILILDMQVDFIEPNGRLPVDEQQGIRAIKTINNVLEKTNMTSREVIYIVNEFDPKDVDENRKRNNAAIKGSKGAMLSKRLNIINDSVFPKNQGDAFSNETFDRYLRAKSINNLIISGVYADHCVLSTIQAALQRKYTVFVIPKTVATSSKSVYESTLEKYQNLGVTLLSTEDAIGMLNKL